MASGDDMEAGRTNEADQITLIVGGQNEDSGDEFGDDIVFLGSYDRDRSPTHAVDGLVGMGWSGTVTSGVAPIAGRGVVGLGGPAAGTGVFGRGGYNQKTYPKSWAIVGGPQVDGNSTGGIGVHGAGGDATDFGFLGPVDPGIGVLGQGGKQHQFNTTRQGPGAGVVGVAGAASTPAFAEMQSTGVFGQGGDAETHSVVSEGVPLTAGPKEPGPGVVGRGGVQPASAVAGGGPPAAGLVGVPGGHGVPAFGESANNGVFGKSESGSGVAGVSPRRGFGVSGKSAANHSVFGDNSGQPVTTLAGSFARTSGCYGATMNNRGVSGVVGVEEWAKNKPEAIDGFATGVFGQAGLYFDREQRLTAKGFAGIFLGPVVTWGPLVNFGGPKSAAVPHPDGSHRLLYCVESPESWFEDFGEAKLVKGKAVIKIAADFAAVVNAGSYHVFLSPYGDGKGLYVRRRDRKAFEVREQQGGRSNLAFSYRIVAHRKDASGERLPKFDAASFIVKQVKKQKPAPRQDKKRKK